MAVNDIYCDDAYDIDPVADEAFDRGPLDIGTVKGTHIVGFFLLGLLLCLVSGVSDDRSLLFIGARGLLMVLLFLSVVMPCRFGVPLYFLLLLVSTDILQSSSEQVLFGEQNIASVWRMFVGPLRPSWIIFGTSVILVLRNWYSGWDRRIKWAVIWFATVPVMTGLAYGGFRTQARSIEVLADLRFAIILTTSILLFTGFLKKRPNMLPVMLALFIGGVLAVHLRDIIYWATGRGPVLGGASRASVDSTKSTIVFVLLFALYLITIRRKLLLGGIMTLASLLLIVVFATRLIWVTSVISCMVLMYLLGAKRLLLVVPLVAIMMIASNTLIRSFQSRSLDVAAQRAETFRPEGGNYLANLAPLRYAEVLNSTGTSLRRMSMLWGSGYGGYYTDDVAPFPYQLIDAHPEYAAALGQFFYCHNFISQVYFKHGLIGLFLISMLWLGPTWICFKYIYDRGHPAMLSGFLAMTIAFVPNAMLSLYWTGKGLLINGFIIAVLLCIAQYRTPAEEQVPED